MLGWNCEAPPLQQLASSRDEIWAMRHQEGCYTYSTGVTQFRTAQKTKMVKNQKWKDSLCSSCFSHFFCFFLMGDLCCAFFFQMGVGTLTFLVLFILFLSVLQQNEI